MTIFSPYAVPQHIPLYLGAEVTYRFTKLDTGEVFGRYTGV
jgi:hypothetical protein